MILRSLNKYIPENINIDELLEQFPPSFSLERDKLVHLLSLLNEIPAYDHRKYEDAQGWIPIYTTLVQKQGIRNFPRYKEWMIDACIIETDNRYIVGVKSRCFRFTEKYQTVIRVEPIYKKTLIRAILKEAKTDSISRKTYANLYQWFDGLEIDVEAAKLYLHDKYRLDLENGVSHSLKKLSSSLINIDKIANKQFHFSVDQSAGRLHHNLTNIKSELRNFISYKGQPLVSIDIRNSQPVMALLLLNPEFWGIERSKLLLNDNVQKNFENQVITNFNFRKILSFSGSNTNILHFSNIFFQNTLNRSSLIMLAELLKSLDEPDVQTFIQKVVKGELYEYMEEQIRQHNEEITKAIKSRRDLKAIIFTVLFTSNRFFHQDNAKHNALPKRIFESIFPNVYRMLAFVKQYDKTILPLLLQSIESKLILEKVAKRISKEKPMLPIFTIHDSITTTVGNEQYVKKVILEEISKMIGILPVVKEEYWLPSNINLEQQKMAS